MSSGMKELRERADRAVMGTSLPLHIVSERGKRCKRFPNIGLGLEMP